MTLLFPPPQVPSVTGTLFLNFVDPLSTVSFLGLIFAHCQSNDLSQMGLPSLYFGSGDSELHPLPMIQPLGPSVCKFPSKIVCRVPFFPWYTSEASVQETLPVFPYSHGILDHSKLWCHVVPSPEDVPDGSGTTGDFQSFLGHPPPGWELSRCTDNLFYQALKPVRIVLTFTMNGLLRFLFPGDLSSRVISPRMVPF